MKRLQANRPDWKRVTERRFYCAPLDTPDFKGHVSLLCLDAVREPLVVGVNTKRICIADAG